jgi:hypothetical protein
VEELLTLSEVLGISPLRALDAAGRVPGISRLVDYIDQLEELAGRTEYVAARLAFGPPNGASVIAGAAAASGRYRATMEPLWQGTGRYRRHYCDLVALEPMKAASQQTIRTELEDLLAAEMAWFGAGFIANLDTARHLPAPDPSLVITVPRFVAIRRAGTAPAGGAPHSVCVLGGHWSGSADVASFLGYAFDYDYAHVGFAASRAYSRLTHHWDHGLFERDRFEIARTYTLGADIGRSRCWAAGGDSYAATCELVCSGRHRNPVLIHLRVTDDLIVWAADARARFGHTSRTVEEDVKSMTADRRTADLLVSRIPHRAIRLDVTVPCRSGTHTEQAVRDGFFDQWAGLSEEALRLMHDELQLRFDLADCIDRLRSGGQETA